MHVCLCVVCICMCYYRMCIACVLVCCVVLCIYVYVCVFLYVCCTNVMYVFLCAVFIIHNSILCISMTLMLVGAWDKKDKNIKTF